jgi:hypothetical protein
MVDNKAQIVGWLAWLFDFASSNQILSGLAVVAIGAVFAFLWRVWRNWLHSNKIYAFLRSSADSTDYEFRSTEAISAATRLSEGRVAELAIKDKRLARNTKGKQSWRVTS